MIPLSRALLRCARGERWGGRLKVQSKHGSKIVARSPYQGHRSRHRSQGQTSPPTPRLERTRRRSGLSTDTNAVASAEPGNKITSAVALRAQTLCETARTAQLDHILAALPALGITDPAFCDSLDPRPLDTLLALLGAGSEQELFQALELSHAHAELLPENFMVAGRDAYGHGSRDGAALLGTLTDRTDGSVLGFFCFTIQLTKTGPESYLDYIVVDKASPKVEGVAAQLLEKMEALDRQRGVKREVLNAEWIGRLVWARRGYDFADAATRADFRRRLGNLLRHLDVPLSSLRLRAADGGVTALRSLEELQHPWQYAQLFSTRGKVQMDILVGEDRVGDQIEIPRVEKAQQLDLGRAFLLGNYTDSTLAPMVAPAWDGARELDPFGARSGRGEASPGGRAA